MFGFMFELGGDLISRPGCGQLYDVSVSSLIIRRKSSEYQTDHTDQGWEELVTPNALRGLIPEALIDQYDFWKDLDSGAIRGSARLPKDDWSDYDLLLQPRKHDGRSECFIRRRDPRGESMVLLNLQNASCMHTFEVY